MLGVVKTLLKLFGIGNGESTTNRAAGVVNHLLFLPVISYLVANADKRINFETSLGFLALVAGFLYWHMEIQRRSRPAYQGGGNYE